MEKIQEVLAKNIAAARRRLNVSQETLADMAGVDRTFVSGIERRVRNPSITIVAKLAKALGCTAADLLREDAE